MDERFEALCEIGDLVINAGRHDLVETYYDLLCEHYPADILTSLALGKVSSEEESEESEDEGMRLELEPEPELKEMGEEVQEEEDDKLEDENVDYDSGDSESDGDLTDEEFEIKCDENGFLSLA